MVQRYLLYCCFIAILVVFQNIQGDVGPWMWPDGDYSYDGAVGITYAGQIVGMGIVIRPSLVITSANPIERYVDDFRNIRIHVVHNYSWINGAVQINCLMFPFLDDNVTAHNRFTGGFRVRQGYDDLNSPIHDLMTLATEEEGALSRFRSRPFWKMADSWWDYYHYYNWEHRPLVMKIIERDHFFRDEDLLYIGFGYKDMDHIKNMTVLKVENRGGTPVRVNCDEIVPRNWGIFICIRNTNNDAGVQSGSPLFHRGKVIGLGCFSITRNNESTLVFTDLRPYIQELRYCAHNATHDIYSKYLYKVWPDNWGPAKPMVW